MRCFHYHRSNVTGHRRGSNDSQKITVRIGCGHCPQGSLAKGSWHGEGVTEGFTMGAFAKAPTYVETCYPGESPRFCQRQNHPPLARGALGEIFYFFRSFISWIITVGARARPATWARFVMPKAGDTRNNVLRPGINSTASRSTTPAKKA